MRNTDGLAGRLVSDQSLLQALGYGVIILRIEALPRGSNSLAAQLQYLSALLARHGVPHPVSAADAQASAPQEFAVREPSTPSHSGR